jgi:rhamnosyltransferase
MLVVSFLCSKESPLAPAVLMSGLWFVCTLIYMLYEGIHPAIGTKFLLNMGLWVGCFCLSALTMQSLRVRASFKDILPSATARNIYFYISLATLPLLGYDVYRILNAGLGSNPFHVLRIANIHGVEQLGIETTSVAFGVVWLVAYILELLCYSKENRWRVFFLLAINLFYATVSMSKMVFLTIFLATVIILFYRKRIKMRTIVVGLAALFIGFMVLQTVRDHHRDKVTTKDFIALYTISAIPAFERYVEPQSSKHWGENTFRLAYAVPYKLGFSAIEPVDPLLGFVQVTIDRRVYRTNVYTTLFPFYKDFGTAGVVVAALFLGLLFGYLFKLVQQKDCFALTLYALLGIALVMQFMEDIFFTTLSANIQYMIFALIPFFISKYHLFEKKDSSVPLAVSGQAEEAQLSFATQSVDILIATYNGEAYLDAQITSIINQTHSQWRLILHDDGSCDNTVNLCCKWMQTDSRIVFVEDDMAHQGVAAHFITLLRYSNADYVMFADQDDIWLPDKIEMMLASIVKKDNRIPQAVFSNAFLWNEKDGITAPRNTLSYPRTLESLLFLNAGVQGAASIFNSAMRNILLQPLAYYAMHDHVLALAAITLGQIDYIDYSLFYYRQHAGNVTGKAPGSFMKKCLLLWRNRAMPVVCFAHYEGLKAFYAVHKHTMNEHNKVLIEIFLALPEMSCGQRISKIIRHRFNLFGSTALLIGKIMIRPYFKFNKSDGNSTRRISGI